MGGKMHTIAMLSAFVGLAAFVAQEVDARGAHALEGAHWIDA